MNKQRISSALGSIKIRQIPSPLIIGERLNTQGSRMAKRLVMEDDYEGCLVLVESKSMMEIRQIPSLINKAEMFYKITHDVVATHLYQDQANPRNRLPLRVFLPFLNPVYSVSHLLSAEMESVVSLLNQELS